MIQGQGLHNPAREPVAWVVYSVTWAGKLLGEWRDYREALAKADRNPGSTVTAVIWAAPRVYGSNRTIDSDIPQEKGRRVVYAS